MDVAVTTSIIGVIGTIFGTILGWVLNTLSQSGDIVSYISNWEDSFWHTTKRGDIISEDWNEATKYSCSFYVDFYNSSNYTKIMRKFFIVFKQQGEYKFGISPTDGWSREEHGDSCYSYKGIGSINIPPKTVVQHYLFTNIYKDWPEFRKLKKCDSVWLSYENDKGDTKYILLSNKCFDTYFEDNDEDE